VGIPTQFFHHAERHMGLYVKWPLLLSDLNQIWDGYSSYHVVILTINIILPTTFEHIYWYIILVSAIKWPSSVVG
jgi:hypothetical protein